MFKRTALATGLLVACTLQIYDGKSEPVAQ